VESYSQELASNLVFLGKNSWQLELAGAAIALFGVSIIRLNPKNPDKDMAHELKYRKKLSEQGMQRNYYCFRLLLRTFQNIPSST
jgi:hypothetical protein